MITSVAVTFIEGKRRLSVDIDFRSAVTMEVPNVDHCAELIAILWPGLGPHQARLDMATKGGGISLARLARAPIPNGGTCGRD